MRKVYSVLLAVLIPVIYSTLVADLSSKTAYDAVRGDVRQVQPLHNSVGKCTPDRIYMLLRHGSRNFGFSLTTQMQLFLAKLSDLVRNRTVVLPGSMDWYKTWTPGHYYTDYELVPEGMMEHYTIAERYKEAFPHLFPPYSIANYSLQTTSKMRTIQSALSFMDGLHHGTGPLETSLSRLNITMKGYMPPGLTMTKNDEDKLLRFVDSCPKYAKYVDSLKWKTENKLFQETEIYKSAVSALSKAINFTLTTQDAKAIYYLCANEQMSPTQAHHSQFCGLFTTEILKVFDFSKDLEKYYKYSYPFETTYKMSCMLLNDVISSLKSAESTPVLKFAHEETLMPLLSLLDFFDDGQIITHEMKDFINRKMKISEISPFAGNVAFVRHSCPGDPEPRIQIIINEKEETTTWCSAPGCTASQLDLIVTKRADKCQFDKICDVAAGTQRHSVYLGIAVLLTVCIIQATYIFFHCVKRCPMRNYDRSTEVHRELLNSETSDEPTDETELRDISPRPAVLQ